MTKVDHDDGLTDEQVRMLATPEHTLSSTRSVAIGMEAARASKTSGYRLFDLEQVSKSDHDQNIFKQAIREIGEKVGLIKGHIKDEDYAELANNVKDWIRENPGKAALYLGSSVTVIPIIFPGLISIPALGIAGFGANGVVSGSVAAGVQPATIAAGGAFATAQSAAMGGYGLPIINGVRSSEELSSLLLLSSTNRTPLITLWTASWCSSCRTVRPFLQNLIEHEGLGEKEGGVGYAEVEMDSPNIGSLAGQYFVNSIPTLLSFRAQEAALDSKVTSIDEMKDREFMRMWLEEEARRGGDRGGGGGSGFLGSLFGLKEKE
ncbi:MAG: hypothetical protein Q9220_005380 [cf. Caloplaca sp. 1 TL-2023]